MKRLLLAAVVAGCATGAGADIEPVPLPDGTYEISGTIGMQSVVAKVHVTGDRLLIESNHGSCRSHIDYEANRGRVLRDRMAAIGCDGGTTVGLMRLTLSWEADGDVDAAGLVSVTEMQRKRGDCVRWSTGVSPSCLAYEWINDPVTRWVSGRLSVVRRGESGGGDH